MLLQRPQSIPTRQSKPITPTMLLSPGRSCVSSTSAVLVNESWNHIRTASLRRTDTKSSDDFSVDFSSPTRTSWDSGSSNGASSNTSIHEPSTGLDRNITQRIEAEVDRISMEIAQSHSLNDGLRNKHGNSSLDHPTAHELDFALPVPHIQDISLALTDPHLLGDPIFMSTAGFEVGPAGLRIGRCSYLNLPAGDCCTLRIIGPAFADGRPRFQLIISTTILDMRTTEKSWKLSSIHDVTDMINEMAVDRLTYDLNMQSAYIREDSQGIAPKYLEKMKIWDEPFDWNTFTEDESATHDQGPARPCKSPDTLNTPDDITRFIQGAELLKSQTKKFFILTPRPLEHRKRNVIEVFRRKKSIWAIEIANLVVSFVSNDLLHKTHVLDRLSNHLRRCTADSVTKCFGGSEGFEWRATLRPGIETVINCFPVDNDRDAMAREVWWICFVET